MTTLAKDLLLPVHHSAQVSKADSTGNPTGTQTAQQKPSSQQITPRSKGSAIPINQTQPQGEPDTTSEEWFHWCVDQDDVATKLDDFETHTVTEDGFSATLIQKFGKLRRWPNWISLSECVGVRFVQVSQESILKYFS